VDGSRHARDRVRRANVPDHGLPPDWAYMQWDEGAQKWGFDSTGINYGLAASAAVDDLLADTSAESKQEALNKFNKEWGATADKAGQAARAFQSKWGAAVNKAGKTYTQAADEFKNKWGATANNVAQKYEQLRGKALGAIGKAVDKYNALSSKATEAYGKVAGAYDEVMGKWNEATGKLDEEWQKANAKWDQAKEVWNDLQSLSWDIQNDPWSAASDMLEGYARKAAQEAVMKSVMGSDSRITQGETLQGCGSYKQVTSVLSHSADITFTYKTSDNPDKAGPAQNAFLVPAVWFEVHRVWNVRVGRRPAVDGVDGVHADGVDCRISGEMDTALVPNVELSGFTFTTANDVETRTLPLLMKHKDDIDFRLNCDIVGSPAACCSPDDTALGCMADSLEKHCAFKYAHDQGRQKECSATADNMFKAACKDGSGFCNRGVIEANTLQQYCEQAAVAENVPESTCLRFNDVRTVINAHNDWYDILDRNYRHHEKARLQKNGEKGKPVYFNAHVNSNTRYGPIRTEVEVRPLAGLAPSILIDRASGFDDAGVSQGQKEKFRSWNVVGFVGGGASIEMTTNQFAGTAGIEDFEVSSEKDEERTYEFKNEEKRKLKNGHLNLPSSSRLTFRHNDRVSSTKWKAKTVILKTTTKDTSSAVFHLEDPDVGGDTMR